MVEYNVAPSEHRNLYIREENPYRKYFHIIPNMVGDLGLDPYTYRLYGHLKKVAGEKGECWQSAKTIAAACNMSTAQVSISKKILEEHGLIIIEEIPNPHGGRPYHSITICDIWKRNYAFYAEQV